MHLFHTMQGPFQLFGEFGEFCLLFPVGIQKSNLRLRVLITPFFLSPFADLSIIRVYSPHYFEYTLFFSSDSRIIPLPAALVPFSHISARRCLSFVRVIPISSIWSITADPPGISRKGLSTVVSSVQLRPNLSG